MKLMFNKITFNVSLLILAIFLTVSTTFKKVEVFSHSDLNAVSCGWPLRFVTQDQGWRDPPYPWKVSCFASPLENPTKFNWQYFILNATFFYLLILAFLRGRDLIVKKK